MTRSSLASLACLLLVGCPTTNSLGDAGPRVDASVVDAAAQDAPVVPCMPEGTWAPSRWEPLPSNAADCMPPELTPVSFNAAGLPIGSDGAVFVCPAMCDAMSCSVEPVGGPECRGLLTVGRACTGGPGGTALFVLRGDTFEFEVVTESGSGPDFCAFTALATRVMP